MTVAKLTYKVAPYRQAFIGKGSYSTVFKAVEIPSGAIVALKKSRASKTLKRPTLRHESRVLRLLQGHASIPVLYGYGHLEHFEYIAMEYLGPSVAQQKKEGSSVELATIIRIIDQTSMSTQFGLGQPGSKYNPLKDHKHIVGTIYWASLNSHNGEDITPRDDIESLAYVAFFLLYGTLPWKPRPYNESTARSQEIVRLVKTEYNPAQYGVPEAFSKLLVHGRSLLFHQLPDHVALKQSFRALAMRKGYNLQGPLDWTPCDSIRSDVTPMKEPDCSLPSDHEDDDWCEASSYEMPTNSYFARDIALWDPQGDRDKDLTLPSDQEVALDGRIACIVDVMEGDRRT